MTMGAETSSVLLLAVTVYDPAVPPAVYNPPVVTDPPVALHVAGGAESTEPSLICPTTTNCCDAPVRSPELVGESVRLTSVIGGGGGGGGGPAGNVGLRVISVVLQPPRTPAAERRARAKRVLRITRFPYTEPPVKRAMSG
jgi:hypothetical protein